MRHSKDISMSGALYDRMKIHSETKIQVFKNIFISYFFNLLLKYYPPSQFPLQKPPIHPPFFYEGVPTPTPASPP